MLNLNLDLNVHLLEICHWNLNRISAQNYIKLLLLKAYIAIHKFDIIFLSETYLDSSTTSNDDNFAISGYNLIRSNHPSNNKRGGVCIYCKKRFTFACSKYLISPRMYQFRIKY